ncbi:MAG: hypothetical protein AAF989_10500 [Planctomycetota bacterium]
MANSKPENPSAFPYPYDANTDGMDVYEPSGGSEGMTLRDYFAAKALMGSIAYSGQNAMSLGSDNSRKVAAEWCYEMADVMLAARSKGGES